MRFLGIPGIYSDGDDSIDTLGPLFEAKGYEYEEVKIPIRGVWSARRKSEIDALRVVEIARPGDVLLAHSRGCLVAATAMKYVRFKAVFLFRPAMSRNYKFPPHAETDIFCIHSKQDWIILLGALLRFHHPFGLAGMKGFRDKSITNVASHGWHSHDFKHDRAKWVRFVIKESTR